MNRLQAIRDIRARLSSGAASVGSWMQLADSNVAELLASGGYDWVALDCEHAHFSLSSYPDLMRAIEHGGALPMVRVATPTVINCRQALDAGAGGVVIPMITSAQQLGALVSGCHWPPKGTRGVGLTRANRFGADFDAYVAEAQEAIVVAQIEHVEAIAELPAIAAVEGLDAVMIGPYDLSASLGCTGDLENPRVREAIDRIRDACRTHGVPVGTHVVTPDPAALRSRIAEGYQFVAYGVDTTFLRSASGRPTA